MGRVNSNQTPPSTTPNPPPTASLPPITHFTHPHELHPISLINLPPNTLCSGCRLQSSAIMYSCQPCNFLLHQSCTKFPKQITHPSHVGCTLTLLIVPTYPGGIFSCDGCSRTGDGWSYHCTRCDYDLHVTCAAKPLKIKHQSHITCELDLTFRNPYPNTNGFSCDICRKIGSNQWLYRCHSCEFDVHLDCKGPINNQSALQHHHSLPVHPHFQQNPLMHSQSTGSINLPPSYGLNNQFPGQVDRPVQGHGYVQGNHQPVMRPVNNQQQGFGNTLMMSAMQGLVEGAAQGIGQAVVQDVIGGGGGGSGGAGNGNGNDYSGGGGADVDVGGCEEYVYE